MVNEIVVASLIVTGTAFQADPDVKKLEAACAWHLSNFEAGGPDYCEIARQLARDKKWDSIQVVFARGRCNKFQAELAREIVSVSSGADAVMFLKTLTEGSRAWHLGALHVPKNPDAAVSAYLKEVVRDKGPEARATCYAVCQERKWPDLLEQARTDSMSTERYSLDAGFKVWSFALADAAKSYRVELGDLPKDTPITRPQVRSLVPPRLPGQPLFPPSK
ncbi:hypothetical protein GobsT_52880 [Gemmata obscuriglobus]|uniref:hypothetical protein n=1 Tax=Gemmata obscuriglobus TaxID=114 RepID=UPI00016C467A|nr:hypothetical protein [Gemmata obscuriglobus]QEG30483.1 hypothetical protein GobsT_52880 [Gemmata obscuriglobus]VTS09807.1 unnamed protein product [Gemmata obscuriglobus UQM 2246]